LLIQVPVLLALLKFILFIALYRYLRIKIKSFIFIACIIKTIAGFHRGVIILVLTGYTYTQ
jgi:hypothetical protein